jgi:hypothetical protein
MPIPKIIHFTWKTKSLTRLAQRVWTAWEKSHPGWELRLWDDADIRALVADNYPDYLATFDGYPSGIYRADAFRFFVLHKIGGIYSDLDVLPLRNAEELLGQTECFVGAEPEKHVRENDALYRGMPISLCNAFMGSVPGHAFWRHCMDAMGRCNVPDVVDATGPRFINGVALTIDRGERPDVLSPSYWSPLAGDGKKWPTPDGYNSALAKHFRLVGRGEPALVSHLWRNSWFMPIPYKGPSFWRIPNVLQWAWRRRQSGEMSKVRFAPPSADYDNQYFAVPHELPALYLAIDLTAAEGTDCSTALARIHYPKERLGIGLFGSSGVEQMQAKLSARGYRVEVHQLNAPEPERHNLMLLEGQGYDAVVIIDGRMTDIPTDALERMVSAPRALVGVNVRGEDGGDRNESNFLYHRDVFKHLYRTARQTGVVAPAAGRGRLPLSYFRYLNVAPLTSVGADMLLVRRKVIEAGVRFAAEPYKYHLDAEAFCISARDRGFEVCALPNVVVTTSRPQRTE